jgi:hypothetical protein
MITRAKKKINSKLRIDIGFLKNSLYSKACDFFYYNYLKMQGGVVQSPLRS